ncbi:MAG: hypothetical protein HYX67_01600 [Candidatus Melainabacteria bacterium]|nr:hypothetical protein [Candidatus Melainabacteria bacterium]
MPASTKVDKSPTPMDDFIESKAQPLWHVIVLNILTMSAYTIIWFWKTWRDLAEHANSIDMDVPADPVVMKLRNVSPVLRTLGALVPVLQLFLMPGPFMLLFLLAVAPFVLAQSWLNAYWKTQEPPNTLVRQAFSSGELASLILGAVLLGLIVTGFAIGH